MIPLPNISKILEMEDGLLGKVKVQQEEGGFGYKRATMRVPCGDKTVLHLDCGGGYINLHM